MSRGAAARDFARAVRRRITRRHFFQNLAQALALLALPRKLWAESSPAGAELMDDLVALAAVLVPADVTPGMEAQDVREWIASSKALDPKSVDEIAQAMASFDPTIARVASRRVRFAALSAEERDTVVSDHLNQPGVRLTPAWTKLALPMMTAFYASPRGYTAVGYANSTGTSLPGDLMAYTRPGTMPTTAMPATPGPSK